MPLYTYTAKNLRGEEVHSSQEAGSLEELKQIVFEKGYYLTAADVTGKEVSFKLFGKINKKEFSIFCRQFSVLLNSGLTIVESVETLIEQVDNKKFKESLKEVHDQLLKGKMISESLKEFPDIFPEFFVNMIKVGEASGTLDEVLNRLADYYERENKIRRKVKSASTYPIVVVVITILVVSLLMIKVIPMFVDMLQGMGGEMPFVTLLVINISNFMVNNLIYILVGNVVLIALFLFYINTENGRYSFDKLKLNLPVIKTLTRKIVTAQFSRSMGLLLKSGMPIVRAMDIMSDLIGNKFVEERFKDCAEDVKQGKAIAVSLKKMDIFPALLIRMVSVGENTGELDEMLTRTALFFDEEVEEAIDTTITLIEPCLIVVLAVLIGTILLSVMMPMANIINSVQ